MIQLQILNKVIQSKSIDIVVKYGLTSEHFYLYVDEFNFIWNHYQLHSCVPTKATLINKFPSFSILDDYNECDDYLIDTLEEDYKFSKLSSLINEFAPAAENNANEGLKILLNKLPEVQQIQFKTPNWDIISDADTRLERYLDNSKVSKDRLITSGFPEMDEVLYGWYPGEELVTFLARINEGKSWVMVASAVAAWKQGKRIALYNSEMSVDLVGYRADTIMTQLSNKALFIKDTSVKTAYIEHIETLKANKNSFLVPTKKDIGGPLTVSKIKTMIEQYELDAFYIDQYSGMSDEYYKRGDSRKDRYARLVEQLMDVSIQYSIPIIGAVQANRDTVKNKDSEDMPELDNISNADEIGALSTRVISIRHLKAGLKFKIIKNRYGKNKNSFLYRWDIDKGVFDYIPSNSSPAHKKEENKRKFKDKTDVF